MKDVGDALEHGDFTALTPVQQQRIEDVYNEQNPEKAADCRGTALYVTGIIDEDRRAAPRETRAHLQSYRRSDVPEPGGFFAFTGGKSADPAHLGIVLTDYENPLVFHRNADTGATLIEYLSTVERKYRDAPKTYFLTDSR